jgi:hypothetical protein
MMRDETRKVLVRFVETVRLLSEWNFAKFAMTNSVGATLNFDIAGEAFGITQSIPDAEAFAAALMKIRMLMQNNDPISIGNVAKLMDTDPGLSSELKAWFALLRARLNAKLDRPSMVKLNSEAPTEREILCTFLYGDVGHSDPKYAAALERWKGTELFPFIESLFAMIIVDFLDVVIRIANVTMMGLKGEPIPPPATP